MLHFLEKQLFRIYYQMHRVVRLFSRPPREIAVILRKEDPGFLAKVRLDEELDRIKQFYYRFPEEASGMIDALEIESGSRGVPAQWHEAFIRRLRGVRNRINRRLEGKRERA